MCDCPHTLRVIVHTGKEAAAEALGALVWVSFADPAQRDAMRVMQLT